MVSNGISSCARRNPACFKVASALSRSSGRQLGIGAWHDHDIVLTAGIGRDQSDARCPIDCIHTFGVHAGRLQSMAQLRAEGVTPHVSDHRNRVPEFRRRNGLIGALARRRKC